MNPLVPDQIKVKDEPGLVRDSSSHAILASDLARKRKFLDEQNRELAIRKIGDINSRVEQLEKSVSEIGTTLNKVLEILIERRNDVE